MNSIYALWNAAGKLALAVEALAEAVGGVTHDIEARREAGELLPALTPAADANGHAPARRTKTVAAK